MTRIDVNYNTHKHQLSVLQLQAAVLYLKEMNLLNVAAHLTVIQ